MNKFGNLDLEESKQDEVKEQELPKTKVWVDIFSGDEMVSDNRPNQLLYNDSCLEV